MAGNGLWNRHVRSCSGGDAAERIVEATSAGIDRSRAEPVASRSPRSVGGCMGSDDGGERQVPARQSRRRQATLCTRHVPLCRQAYPKSAMLQRRSRSGFGCGRHDAFGNTLTFKSLPDRAEAAVERGYAIPVSGSRGADRTAAGRSHREGAPRSSLGRPGMRTDRRCSWRGRTQWTGSVVAEIEPARRAWAARTNAGLRHAP